MEIGGGSGNLKEFIHDAFISDIVPVPWIDLTVDAHHIPLKDSCLGNLVLFDVLHHLSSPAIFFAEASRVLRPGGRLLMMEPNVSLASFPVYRFLHHEGLRWTDDPLNAPTSGGERPMDGNQAIPTLIFDTHRSEFFHQFPMFRSVKDEKTDFLDVSPQRRFPSSKPVPGGRLAGSGAGGTAAVPPCPISGLPTIGCSGEADVAARGPSPADKCFS